MLSTGYVIKKFVNGVEQDLVIVVVTGDIDGDSKVISDDAVWLLRNTLLSDIYPVVYEQDINKDGNYTSDDAVYLLRHTLLPDAYPL